MAVARADGVCGGGRAMLEGLGALHAFRPGGLCGRGRCGSRIARTAFDAAAARLDRGPRTAARAVAHGTCSTFFRGLAATPHRLGRHRPGHRRHRQRHSSRPSRDCRRRWFRRVMAAPPRAPATAALGDSAARHSRSGHGRGGHAGGRNTRADRRSCTELRATGDQSVGDAGAEDTEAQQRERGEHDRHGVLDIGLVAAESGGELGEQRRADADDDGEYEDLDAG